MQTRDADVIGSKLYFLRDTGVLGSHFIVTDIFKLPNNESSDSFSYEMFYGWLREVANLLYKEESNSRRCFHKLLMEASLSLTISLYNSYL